MVSIMDKRLSTNQESAKLIIEVICHTFERSEEPFLLAEDALADIGETYKANCDILH